MIFEINFINIKWICLLTDCCGNTNSLINKMTSVPLSWGTGSIVCFRGVQFTVLSITTIKTFITVGRYLNNTLL